MSSSANSFPAPMPPQRLLRLLRPPRALTVLAAPGGFGKSTVLRWWAKNWPSPVIWARTPADEADVAQIARAASSAIQASAEVSLGEADDATGVAHALARVVAPGRHVSLVLEDATHVTLELATDLAAAMAELRRPEVTIVVAGRLWGPAPVATSAASPPTLWLGPSLLRLRAGEARRALEKTLGRAVTDPEVELVSTITDGWPAGLLLASVVLRAGRIDLLEAVSKSEIVLGRATLLALSDEGRRAATALHAAHAHALDDDGPTPSVRAGVAELVRAGLVERPDRLAGRQGSGVYAWQLAPFAREAMATWLEAEPVWAVG